MDLNLNGIEFSLTNSRYFAPFLFIEEEKKKTNQQKTITLQLAARCAFTNRQQSGKRFGTN